MDISALTMDQFSANFTLMNFTPPAGFGGPIDVPEGCDVFPFSINNPWENPDDLVSIDTLNRVNDITYGGLAPLFFLLGVPLNIINMIVFYRHGIKERINLCLFVLALDDVFVVTTILEVKLDWFLALVDEKYPVDERPVLKANIDYMIHTTLGFNHISRFMSLVIAMERCLCVVSPLKARTKFDIKTTVLIIGAGHVILYGCYVIYSLKFDMFCMYDPFIREKRTELFYSEFYLENTEFVDKFESYVLGMVLTVGFDIGVIVSTVITLFKMSQMKGWREKSSTNVSAEQSANRSLNLTRMLVANNIFFVACTTPQIIYQVALLIVPELRDIDGNYFNTNGLLIIITDILVGINSTTSYFFYFIFGTKFRKSVQRLFSRSSKREGKL